MGSLRGRPRGGRVTLRGPGPARAGHSQCPGGSDRQRLLGEVRRQSLPGEQHGVQPQCQRGWRPARGAVRPAAARAPSAGRLGRPLSRPRPPPGERGPPVRLRLDLHLPVESQPRTRAWPHHHRGGHAGRRRGRGPSSPPAPRAPQPRRPPHAPLALPSWHSRREQCGPVVDRHGEEVSPLPAPRRRTPGPRPGPAGPGRAVTPRPPAGHRGSAEKSRQREIERWEEREQVGESR